jgi:U3 small nucleolar RNA-associated protein 19
VHRKFNSPPCHDKTLKMAPLNGSKASVMKRKRVESTHKAVKRARSESSEEDTQSQILLLESEVFESRKNYNNISKLITLAQGDDSNGEGSRYSESSILASIALCRIFTRLMASGDLTKNQNTSEKEAVVILWLGEKYTEYKSTLLQLLGDTDSASTALTLCMRMLKSDAAHLGDGKVYRFPMAFFSSLVERILGSGVSSSLRQEFSEKFLEEYDDIRFHTCVVVE